MGGLVDIPLSRLSVVRAGATATRFSSVGVLETVPANTARIDYDPVTLACRGLLVEESRTNLLLRSAEFDNAVWGKANATVTPNAMTAPDGTVTADKLVEASAAGTAYAGQTVTYTNAAHALSVYAKAGEKALLQMYLVDSGGIVAGSDSRFNLAAGVKTSGVGDIRYVGNGWYRCWTTGVPAAGAGAGRLIIADAEDNLGTSGLYLWGAQLEPGAFPTSYIPTTTAASTRAADWPTVALTSLPGWTPAEWTLVVEHEITGLLPSQVVAGIGSTFGASVYLSYASAVPLGWGAGYGSASFPTTAATIGVHRNAIAMGGTTALISADGGATATVSGIAPPSGATMIGVGGAPWSASNAVGGYIRRLQYLPRKANSTEVRSLSGGTDITGQTVPATGNCLLSWVNLADRAAATITSTSAADGLGAERLKDPQARRRMRTAAGVTSVALTVDAATVGDVGVVAVLQPDDAGYIDADGDAVGFMAATDTIRHRLDAVTPGAGALYDSLYYRDPGYLGATLDLNFTAQSYREFQNDISSGIVAGYGLHAHVLPSAVQPRYWRCDIAATSLATTPGYLDLGRLWAGPAFRPTRNFAYEWSDVWDDLSDTTQVRRSGLDFTDKGPKRRLLTFAFKALTEEEAKVAMTELGRIAGTSKQVLFIQEPNGPYQGRQAIIGRLVEVSPITQPNFALYERVFQIRQSL